MIVLVMAEYLVDSPLWFRGGSEVDRSDVDDASALGVSAVLRDDLRVWCGGGGGMDAVAEWGSVVVLPSGRRGTDVEVLHQGVREVRSARAAGAREATAKAIVH